jgi:hypothetical protein
MSVPNIRKTLLLATAPGRHVSLADSNPTG